jgi:hypothetical protein
LFARALPNLQLVHSTLVVVEPRLSRKKERKKTKTKNKTKRKTQNKRNINVVHNIVLSNQRGLLFGVTESIIFHPNNIGVSMHTEAYDLT